MHAAVNMSQSKHIRESSLYNEYQLTQRLRSGRSAEYRCLCVLSCGWVVYISLSHPSLKGHRRRAERM